MSTNLPTISINNNSTITTVNKTSVINALTQTQPFKNDNNVIDIQCDQLTINNAVVYSTTPNSVYVNYNILPSLSYFMQGSGNNSQCYITIPQSNGTNKTYYLNNNVSFLSRFENQLFVSIPNIDTYNGNSLQSTGTTPACEAGIYSSQLISLTYNFNASYLGLNAYSTSAIPDYNFYDSQLCWIVTFNGSQRRNTPYTIIRSILLKPTSGTFNYQLVISYQLPSNVSVPSGTFWIMIEKNVLNILL